MSDTALVIFSGGLDSTTILLRAKREYREVCAITFAYGQRHSIEIQKSQRICEDHNVSHKIVEIDMLKEITSNQLMSNNEKVEPTYESQYPPTFVEGRNGLFIQLSAIYAKSLDIKDIYIGVSETNYGGYPDTRDEFIRSMEQSIRLGMDYPFNLYAPLMHLTKAQTWEMADELGYLQYVRDNTHTCYNAVEGGCGACPACIKRNQGYNEYIAGRAFKEAQRV